MSHVFDYVYVMIFARKLKNMVAIFLVTKIKIPACDSNVIMLWCSGTLIMIVLLLAWRRSKTFGHALAMDPVPVVYFLHIVHAYEKVFGDLPFSSSSRTILFNKNIEYHDNLTLNVHNFHPNNILQICYYLYKEQLWVKRNCSLIADNSSRQIHIKGPPPFYWRLAMILIYSLISSCM